MMQLTGGQSKPSVKTWQFDTTVVSPDCSRENCVAFSFSGAAVDVFGLDAGPNKFGTNVN